jgi:hypothetical protein
LLVFLFLAHGFTEFIFLGDVSLFVQTFPAKTYEFELVSKDAVLGQATQRTFQILQGISQRRDFRIFDLPAPDTGDVVVIPEIPLKPHLGMPGIDSVDQSRRRENVEIAIYRAHADLGKSPSDLFVNLISRRMGVHFHDLHKNHLPLMGHPVFLFGIQSSLEITY